MQHLISGGYLVLGGVMLYFGADWLIRGGVAVARRVGISMLVIGLTLVAFATSAPELVVSCHAAIKNLGDVSLGNVIGSNICNIALILGVSTLLNPVNINRQILRFDWPILMVATLVFAGIGMTVGFFGRISGAVFLASVIAYTCYLIRDARKQQAAGVEVHTEAEEFSSPDAEPMNVFAALGLVVLGGLVLVFGGKFFVAGATEIARLFGISDAVISLTVIALGTSLPELATSILAAIRKESDIAVGNVIGSNLFNILGILGVAPIIRPIYAQNIVAADWLVMLCVTIILFPMMLGVRKMARYKGVILLIIYIAYVCSLAVR